MMLLLLALSSEVAYGNQLDTLIHTSSQIAGQIDKGTKLVGASLMHSHTGNVAPEGLALEAIIAQAEVSAYNEALQDMSNFLPYGDAQTFLEDKAHEELVLMNQAVDTFTEAVVTLSSVIEVAELASEAQTPNDQAAVQGFVESNYQSLQVEQQDVDQYNQSLQDIEHHANNAGAYFGVSQNKEATEFLAQGAENNNAHFDLATVSYVANQQWVQVNWGTGNASAVYINGSTYDLDLYVSAEEVYFAGENSEYYQYNSNNSNQEFYGVNP